MKQKTEYGNADRQKHLYSLCLKEVHSSAFVAHSMNQSCLERVPDRPERKP